MFTKTFTRNEENQVSEIKTIINPFYVFSGTISPSRFVDIQTELLDQLGPEDYFHLQLRVLHSSVSQLISELTSDPDESSDGFFSNVSYMGHA